MVPRVRIPENGLGQAERVVAIPPVDCVHVNQDQLKFAVIQSRRGRRCFWVCCCRCEEEEDGEVSLLLATVAVMPLLLLLWSLRSLLIMIFSLEDDNEGGFELVVF